MKWPFLFILIVLFCGCKPGKDLVGYYYVKGKDYEKSLQLNKDGSFILKELYFEANASCKGKWHYLSRDTLILACDTVGVLEQLQSGYISDRHQKIAIVNKNQIKIRQSILTRSKSD